MANTGKKIVLTLEEIADLTGLPTGNTKPNVIGDPDYIAPSIDLTTCPITYDISCPVSIISGSSGTGILSYEFSLPPTVLNNPIVNKISISAMNGSTAVGTVTIVLPNTTGGYFGGDITALSAATYTLRVRYLNSADVVQQTCNGITTATVS